MEGEKIILLKDTLKYLVDILWDDDRLCIVTYATNAARRIPLQRVSEMNKPKIISLIDSLDANDGTDITEDTKIL